MCCLQPQCDGEGVAAPPGSLPRVSLNHRGCPGSSLPCGDPEVIGFGVCFSRSEGKALHLLLLQHLSLGCCAWWEGGGLGLVVGTGSAPQNIPDMEVGITKSPLQLSAGLLLQNLFSAPMQGHSLVYLRQLEGYFTWSCASQPQSHQHQLHQVHGHSSRLWAPHGLLQHQLTAPREAEATHGSPLPQQGPQPHVPAELGAQHWPLWGFGADLGHAAAC